MEGYTYSPIDSQNGQFRLLKLRTDWAHDQIIKPKQKASILALAGSLKAHSLPISSLSLGKRAIRTSNLPTFHALSYVWGDPTPSSEILLDGKLLMVTQSLYVALRAIQRDANEHHLYVWADAICINQQNLEERSLQVVLMREIYHAASYVRIWLGQHVTSDHLRCIQYIRLLNGDGALRDSSGAFVDVDKDPGDTPEITFEENKVGRFFEVVGVPVFKGMQIFSAIDKISDGIQGLVRNPNRDEIKAKKPPEGVDRYRTTAAWKALNASRDWRPASHDMQNALRVEPIYDKMRKLIDRVFIQDNEWFTRMWVVQEVACAKNPSIQIGPWSVWWDRLARTCRWLGMENFPRLIGLDAVRVQWLFNERRPLIELIQECRHRKATDPRDKIYSLAGLMKDTMNEFLRPSYADSVATVYAKTTLHFISQMQILDPICGWQSSAGSTDLPSWVPDYTLDQELAGFNLANNGTKFISPPCSASGKGYRSKYVHQVIRFSQSLKVSGVCIDTVVGVSTRPTGNEYSSNLMDLWLQFLFSYTQDFQITSEQKAELEIVTTRIKYRHQFAENDPGRIVEVLSPICNAYVSALYLEKKHGALRLRDFGARGEDRDLINVRGEIPLHGLQRRRLAVTRNKILGALRMNTEVGDIICVLFGCSVPVVLRKRDDGAYTFMGDCYLHGFMNGKAIEMLDDGKLEEMDFELK